MWMERSRGFLELKNKDHMARIERKWKGMKKRKLEAKA